MGAGQGTSTAFPHLSTAADSGRPPFDLGNKMPPKAKLNKALSLLKRGKPKEALAKSAPLLKQYPNNKPLLHIVARASRQTGKPETAMSCLNRILRLDPKDPYTLLELGDTQKLLGDGDAAEASYKSAISVDPTSFGPWNNLGTLYLQQGRQTDAVRCLTRALDISPESGLAHFNLANSLRSLGRYKDAKSHIDQAFADGFSSSEATYLLAAILRGLGQYDEAITVLGSVLETDPGHFKARTDQIHLKAHLADWSWIAEFDAHVKGRYDDPSSPFVFLAMEDDAAAQHQRSLAYSVAHWPKVADRPPARPRIEGSPINVGYFSWDFHDHATMHLLRGLFKAHDPSRFRAHIYSYDTNEEDETRRRLIEDAYVFRDVTKLSDAEVANLAQSDKLDVAIDLKGHTKNTRLGIFAHRPAPIQVTWLGYPGTLGTGFMDYIIADAVTIPPEADAHYSEKILRLPHCYQINDAQRPGPGAPRSRADDGLPEDGFVFCSFNSTYKICPRAFRAWMTILKSVDNSVLWLLAPHDTARMNLLRAAEEQGVDTGRLIFAARQSQADHLARHQNADLFLDTFAVNAHTTASDALWCGLPVLTKIGNQFAARVAASLLTACDLPELIVENDEDYIQCAITYAHDQQRRQRVTEQLGIANTSLRLFDTKGFARDLESILEHLVA